MRWSIRLLTALVVFASVTANAQTSEGRDLFARPDKGNCAACHQVPTGAGPAVRANLGPRLDADRLKGWDKARVRTVIEDPTLSNPETAMPPYARHRILEPREIDGIVEYLLALPSAPPGEPATGSTEANAEVREQAPQESRAPGSAEAIEAGRKIWTRKFGKGRSLAGCFPNGGRRIATAYPQYDARMKRVVTLETAINQCLKAHGQPLLDAGDPGTMGAVLAYLRSLSAGQKIAMRVAAPQAGERLEEGRRLYYTRMGQQNYACASCHVRYAGRYLGNVALPEAAASAVHWPYFRDGRAESLQMRMRACLERMGAAPFPPGSDELAHIEFYLAYLANGTPLQPNAWRPQ
jgi:L-cysteine S-thiosulfotransferase